MEDADGHASLWRHFSYPTTRFSNASIASSASGSSSVGAWPTLGTVTLAMSGTSAFTRATVSPGTARTRRHRPSGCVDASHNPAPDPLRVGHPHAVEEDLVEIDLAAEVTQGTHGHPGCVQVDDEAEPLGNLVGVVGSDAPVLILSGGIDPATPPHHAELVAATLPNARHLVAPHLGHGVSMHGCAPRLIERFVRAGSGKEIDAACLARIPRPTFVLPMGTAP